MDDFTAASQWALHFLRQTYDFSAWIITRLENDNWVVLSAEDSFYNLHSGFIVKAAESISSRMLAGLGPSFAPDVSLVAAYAEAPVVQQMKIGGYFGLPIRHADGRIFGMICALDPRSQPHETVEKLKPLHLVAELLSRVLAIELRCVALERECERIATEASRDELTGVYNRRGWTQFIEKEELRCRRYGHSACIVTIDLDRLKQTNDTRGHAVGDDLLRAAAAAMVAAVRGSDVVARIGGDEFSVLCIEFGAGEMNTLEQRLRASLEAAGVSASLGRAMRNPTEGLLAACRAADHAMYAEKARRRGDKRLICPGVAACPGHG